MLISTSRLRQLRLLGRQRLAAPAAPPAPPRRQRIAAAAAEQAAAPALSAQAASPDQPERQGKPRSKQNGSDAAGAATRGGASSKPEEAAQGKQQQRQRGPKPGQPHKGREKSKQQQPKQQPRQAKQDEQQPRQQAGRQQSQSQQQQPPKQQAQRQQSQSQQQQPKQQSQELQCQRRQLQQRAASQAAASLAGSSAAEASKQRGEKHKSVQAGQQAAAPGQQLPQPPQLEQQRSPPPQQPVPTQQPQVAQARQGGSSVPLVSGRMRAQAGGQAPVPPPAGLPSLRAASADGSGSSSSSSGSSGSGSGSGSSRASSSGGGSGSTAPDGGASTSRQRRRVAAAFLRQKFADALLAGQQALGIPMDQKATDVLRQLSQSSDRHVANTLDRVSRQAGRQTDKLRARQQQLDLLRARLANLQQRQQQRGGRQAGAAGEARSGSGGEAGKPQPAWDIEAAEALCNVGLSAEEAAEALLAAHTYRTRRLQALAGSAAAGTGAAAAQPQQATAAAAAAAHGSPSSGGPPSQPAAAAAGPAAVGLAPLSAAEVEAVCSVLLDTAKLGIAQLRPVLVAAPQLLVCSPDEMAKQHAMLASVWRRPRRLSAAIAKHPAMLAPGFPAALGGSLRELSALGMRKDQVSVAILNCPAVTKYTRQQMAATLMSVGLDLSTAPMNVLQFLSDHPQLLTPEGAPELGAKLRLFASWRLPPPMCPLLLARCPALLRESEDQLQVVVDIFLGYGITWPDLHAVLLGYPPVLRVDTNIVRLTLKLLADFEIDFGRVVRYPRVFVHDPIQVIGPRLAYLAAFKPGHLSSQLVSLLSRCDDEFASLVCRRLPDEYAVFKDAWVCQFYEQVQLPASRGGGAGQRPNTLSQRLWSREITDELWL